jgi:hypothetical protein
LDKDLFFGPITLKPGDAKAEAYMDITELKTN